MIEIVEVVKYVVIVFALILILAFSLVLRGAKAENARLRKALRRAKYKFEIVLSRDVTPDDRDDAAMTGIGVIDAALANNNAYSQHEGGE